MVLPDGNAVLFTELADPTEVQYEYRQYAAHNNEQFHSTSSSSV